MNARQWLGEIARFIAVCIVMAAWIGFLSFFQ